MRAAIIYVDEYRSARLQICSFAVTENSKEAELQN